MLIFTVILTLTLETVMLKFVFLGIHFYIGCGLCAFILYLLLSLGFSNPGFGFEDYEQMQYHYDVEGCSEKCRHQGGINLVLFTMNSGIQILLPKMQDPLKGQNPTLQHL